MAPTTGLENLPFDILYGIVTTLDDRDFIHLSRTSRTLHESLQSDQIARKTVEHCLLHSKEGQAAVAAQSGYRKAVGHRFDTNEAVATANPYHVACVGYAADFIYAQGHLAYRCQNHLRVLNVHGAGTKERVLDLAQLLLSLPAPMNQIPADNTTLLSYGDDILVFRVTGVNDTDDVLFVIDMRSKLLQPLFQARLPAAASIFVRNTRSYLWYGTSMGTNDSLGVWSITGMDLDTYATVNSSLDAVFYGDLGKTLCFAMHGEYLYAVSTRDVGELATGTRDIVVDADTQSSFYHWTCFAPRDSSRKRKGHLWRRQNQEGPVNDIWYDLSIQKDESTGRPVILECRREWFGGKSKNQRTYYTQRLPTPEEALAPFSDISVDTSLLADMGDDSYDEIPCDERPAKRLRRDYHAEYEPNITKREIFTTGRIKHSSYHLSSSSFVDLVKDTVGEGQRSRDKIRLRTVSRKRKSPIVQDGAEGPYNRLFGPTQLHADGSPVEGSEERFQCRGVLFWPPENSQVVEQLLCPSKRTGNVKSAVDERSLIYSVDSPGVPPGHQALILLGFDHTVRLPTLNSLPNPEDDASTLDEPSLQFVSPPAMCSSSYLVKESPPYYMEIKRGYVLR